MTKNGQQENGNLRFRVIPDVAFSTKTVKKPVKIPGDNDLVKREIDFINVNFREMFHACLPEKHVDAKVRLRENSTQLRAQQRNKTSSFFRLYRKDAYN